MCGKAMTPNSALIHGVPFVSWGEATDLEFSEGVNTDPSRPACVHMITNYWTPELYHADQDSHTFTFPEELDTWQTDKGNAKSIDDIKQPIANGYPVFVFSGATPVGHYWGMPFLYLSGPHDYIFNQGPGALALLLFHDRALRRPLGPVK